MRNFVLGKNVAYATGATLDLVPDGAVGIFYFKDGQLTVTNTGTELKDKGMLVLGRPSKNGGPITLPIYNCNFSYTKGVYSASTKFSADITIPTPTKAGDYSIIVIKKGMKFNERSNFTTIVHITDTSTSAATLATKLADAIKLNTNASGVTASVSSSKITISAIDSGVDYNIVPADLLTGVTVTITTKGIKAYGDANYIIDLANKAAADAGFEYTYEEEEKLYANYPLNPLAQANAADTGFTIFTLKFSEPSTFRTVSESVNQIIQVAFPTGAAQITTFETVCKGIMGENVASGGGD